MGALEPRARAIAVNFLEPVLSGGQMEFVGAFATPFVLKALFAWLGWPERQWECLGGRVHGSQQAAFGKRSSAPRRRARSIQATGLPRSSWPSEPSSCPPVIPVSTSPN
jgi:cytochrome P450